MGYYCTVPQCTSLAGKTKNVKFHRFPRDHIMADKWNLILKRGKPYTKYSKVCSLHFTQADYNVTTMGQWKTLSKDAVPSQNLPKLNPDGTVMVIRKSRTIKYKESKKDDTLSDKAEKWASITHSALPLSSESQEHQENNMAYRLQALNSLANNISPTQVLPQNQLNKPKKQDAIMQTDPIQSEEEETYQHSYTESEKSVPDIDYNQYNEEMKKYEIPKDFSKPNDDYIPQTNEEYNKEAEKYALERKSHSNYEKIDYQKPIIENGFPKIPEVYAFDKDYQNRPDFLYQNQNPYQDSVELLRNQQHNLQILQEQHRVNENQNFFNENHIKQEIDFGNDEEKFIYEANKDQIDTNTLYESQSNVEQQRLLEMQHQVKQEPDTSNGCENVMQPQSSPYYATGGSNNVTAGGYYEQITRPGPELLIAKQNALAAHQQLWQNSMKRPFFYSDSQHYNTPQLLHTRCEDLSRILQ
ncbi:unnamed protein product, partial [Brenthis ino]